MSALEILGFSFHILIIAILLGKIIQPKHFVSGILFVAILIFARFFRQAFIDHLLAGALLELFILSFLVITLYSSSMPRKILTVCIIVFTVLVADFLTLFTLSSLYGYNISDFASLVFPDIPSIIIGNLIFLLVALLIFNVWNIVNRNIDENQMSLFMFFPVSQIYLLMIILFVSVYYSDSFMNIFFTSLIICFLANVGLVIAMKKLTKASIANEKLFFYEKLLEVQLEHYRQLGEYNSNIKTYKHDMKNQIQTIYTLIDNKELYEARKHADELSLNIDSAVPAQFCDNLIIDALLQNKHLEAENSEIKMELIVQLGYETGISDLHLCSIFSNLIDNALQACKNISDPNITPYIVVKCYEKAGFLIIKVINSKQNKIKLSKTNKLLTTKNAPEHGLGLTIVDNITKLYDGELRVHFNDKEFESIAALNMESNSNNSQMDSQSGKSSPN